MLYMYMHHWTPSMPWDGRGQIADKTAHVSLALHRTGVVWAHCCRCPFWIPKQFRQACQFGKFLWHVGPDVSRAADMDSIRHRRMWLDSRAAVEKNALMRCGYVAATCASKHCQSCSWMSISDQCERNTACSSASVCSSRACQSATSSCLEKSASFPVSRPNARKLG